MKNRIISVLLAGLNSLSLVLFTGASAYAEERECSLTLHCVLNDDQGEKPLSGREFAVVRIADVSVEQEDGEGVQVYRMSEGFEEYDCDWNEISFSEMNRRARAIASKVREGDYVCREMTDENGTVIMKLKETGFYLVLCTDPEVEEVSFSPFLISLPQIINGELIYDVISSPKLEGSHPEYSIPKDDNKNAPTTGQTEAFYFPLTIAGILMIAVGASLFIRKKRV